MAKSTQAFLTFAVTLPQPKGASIPSVRQCILAVLKKEFDSIARGDADIKIHLTNKEVKYGA